MPLQHGSGIYMIVNDITKDFYIGSTKNFVGRESGHFGALRKNQHGNNFLQYSFNKYGEEAFRTEIIEEVIDLSLLRAREKFWISQLRPTYNLATVTDNGESWTISEETRKKMSEAARKRPPQSAEVIAIATAKWRLNSQTEEANNKRSQSLMGHEVSDEARKKIVKTNKETWAKKSKEEKTRIAQSRPPETIKAQSDRWKAWASDPELVEIRAAKQRGVPKTREHVEALTEGQRRRREKERENPKPKTEKPPYTGNYSEERRARMAEDRRKWWERKREAERDKEA